MILIEITQENTLTLKTKTQKKFDRIKLSKIWYLLIIYSILSLILMLSELIIKLQS